MKFKLDENPPVLSTAILASFAQLGSFAGAVAVLQRGLLFPSRDLLP